jgi:hypothetical protein
VTVISARIAACAVVLAAAAARAEQHPAVQLDIDACVDAPAPEIRRVVAVELGALLDTSDATADRTRVNVGCEGGAIVLRVDDPVTAKSLARTIAIAETPATARGRLIALAIVELVSASWTELELNPEPRVRASGPRPSPGARDAALAAVLARSNRTRAAATRVELDGGATKFFGGTGVLAGAGVRVAGDAFAPLSWIGDFQAHHGTLTTHAGDVSTNILALGAAIAVRRTWGAWSVNLGCGLRGGAAELAGVAMPGTTTQAGRFWAPWLGIGALGSVDLRLPHRFVVAATLEGGDVIVPVGGLVDGQRTVAIDGTWLAVEIGFGVFL